MNQDERFDQRWDFRRKEVDGYTSSDDNGSNSSGDPANRNHKLVTNLVLVENDEEDPECEEIRHEKVEETKNKSNKKKKKKQGLQKKKSEANGNKRKRKVNTNETATLKDLKMFANSLIHELSVTRENMFAHMREEMRKSASSKSNSLPINKNVKRSQKNEKNESRRANKQQKGDKLRPSDMNHRLVTSSNIPLPSPQFQTPNNHILQGVPKNIPSVLEIEIGKRFSSRIPKFQPQELLGSFSHNHQKTSVGLLGQNNCIQGSGFPIPLIQGTRDGFNTSSLTYCENAFADNNGVGVRMNARFPAGWS